MPIKFITAWLLHTATYIKASEKNRSNVTQALFWNQESKINGVKTMKEWLKSLTGRYKMALLHMFLCKMTNFRLRAVSLFSVVRRAKCETRKWPRVWLMVRDGKGTKKERLPAKPERMVFHGLVIFWHQNWGVDRPGQARETLLKSLLEQQRFFYFSF